MPVVTFTTEPDGPGRESAVRVEVPAGATVHDAARAGDVDLVSPCGGAGRCGRCVVEVAGTAPEPTECERARLGADDIESGRRLACELVVGGDIEVVIPASSRAAFVGILEKGDCVPFPLEAAVTVRGCRLPEPSLADPRSDLERLAACLGDGRPGFALECELDASRVLPAVLRANGFSAEFVLRGRRLFDVRPPGAGARVLGAAFDIGTTTVAGALVDLSTGERLGLGSRTNPQHAVGDDVVSRMDYAARGPAELADLQRRIAECLNDLLDELARAAGTGPEEVYDLVVAGNTVMKHLFLGLPPQAMATVPFTPVVTSSVDVAAVELGLRAARSARVWTTPAVSAYVGGDIVAGLVAVGFGGFRDDTLYIDIGTNGEVVAGSGERAFCAATAAGPAFEGARISTGMRAVPGAISHARVEGDRLALEVIGDAPPAGVCGTGLVDLVAGLLEAGVIDPSGRIEPREGCPLASLVRDGERGAEIVVASGPEGDVTLSQGDVRELQLAKGAISAGASVLLERAGVDPAALSRVLLAGAFGSRINPASAVAVGLLPPGTRAPCVRAVGNAAAAGAGAALISRAAREEATRLAASLESVELSADPDFQTRFAESMMFPDPAGIPEA